MPTDRTAISSPLPTGRGLTRNGSDLYCGRTVRPCQSAAAALRCQLGERCYVWHLAGADVRPFKGSSGFDPKLLSLTKRPAHSKWRSLNSHLPSSCFTITSRYVPALWMLGVRSPGFCHVRTM